MNHTSQDARSLAAAITIFGSLVTGTNAALIGFTGGTVTLNSGATGVTNQLVNYQDVSYYAEGGFKLEFFFDGAPDVNSSNIGDYYDTRNDVIHTHWVGSILGNATEIRVSKLDGSNFYLGGFAVTSNTAGGLLDPADGSELVMVNSSKANNVFSIGGDDWGLGNGPDPIYNVTGNPLLSDISWFSFTNGPTSTSVGFGLDNFHLDEAGDPAGSDPTPEPSSTALLGLGGLALLLRRRR